MQKQSEAYKNSEIWFGVEGTGPSLIVCLHGFGENMDSFAFLNNTIDKHYTLLCIDLPFHGDTKWQEGLLFAPDELLQIINGILERSGFSSNCKFSLLGYSLGGRIALHLLRMIPERIERVVLIAPDGLRVNFWYWLGTQTYIGNKLFHITMQHPDWFFAMTNFAYKTGFLNKSIIKFLHYYLDDKEARLMLYKRWTTLRKFKPDLPLVRKIIKERKIPVRFIFGNYDRIILYKRSDAFKKDKENVKVLVLNTGHQLLKEKYAVDIAMQFSQ
ncbi:alpha/beta hydrolase [Panacibacter ginsenosidivorans]|uniref:Alpha/beta hydrolase n=1 Tax=Panacibacter ginsenosidivorans TaxID=1813871 RepID=A0A5B8V965_9BACT|nr:alpha/beta hydrolase [Panacibacter ginsenosidivorans]QEC68047.1 alpha/beta hydrolase [Panacibacter ginsenosidivorans]